MPGVPGRGADWYAHDSCSARVCSPARVRSICATAARCSRRSARRAADRWSDGGEIDLVAEMSAITLDGAASALFGSDLREPAPQITRALTTLLAGFRLAMAPGGPTLLRSPLPVAIRVRSAKAELENVVDDLIGGRWVSQPQPGPVLELLASQPEL